MWTARLGRSAGLVGVVAMLLLVTGCGGRHGGGSASGASASVAASSSASMTPRVVAERDALAAYAGMWMTMAKDAETSNPDDPELRRYAADKALALVVNSLAVDKQRGVLSLGRPVLHPRVVSLTPPDAPVEAEIEDCGNDADWTKVKASGEPVNSVPGGNRKITATVRVVDGTWKVVKTVVGEVGSC